MRWILVVVALSSAACASPFPIRTCMQAKRAIGSTCGFKGLADWTCWDEPTLRGTGTVLPEKLFACLDGATTCFEVESCLRNEGMLAETNSAAALEENGLAGDSPVAAPADGTRAPAGKP